MNGEIVAQALTRGTIAESFVLHVYAPALATHIGSGVAAVLAGATALLLPKGHASHGVAGRVFVVAMLLIGVSGPLIAKSHIAMLTSILAAYFVATAWRSIRRTADGSNRFEIAALIVALGIAACCVAFGRQAAENAKRTLDGFPASFHYVFAGIALTAAVLDLNVIVRGRVAGAPRLSRHLGRMCFGLLLAGSSFFFGQQDRFPAMVRQSGVLTLITLAPLAFMLFWFVRVRFMSRTRFHPMLEVTGRALGVAYLAAAAIGLLALFLPRGR